MADATSDLVARLLTAEAALVCRPFAGAVALAAGAAGQGRVAVPRGHLVRIGGVSILELIRVAGATPVEVGDVEGCAAEELAAAGATAILVAARSSAAEIAEALWACRRAGTASVVVASAALPPLALLDAGADLVVADIAEHYGGPPTGVIAGAGGPGMRMRAPARQRPVPHRPGRARGDARRAQVGRGRSGRRPRHATRRLRAAAGPARPLALSVVHAAAQRDLRQ